MVTLRVFRNLQLKTLASLKRKDLILYYVQILLNGLDKPQISCCLICPINQLYAVLTDFRALGAYPDLQKVYNNTKQSTGQLSYIFVLRFQSSKGHALPAE